MSCCCFGYSIVRQKKISKDANQSKQDQEGTSTAMTKNFSYSELRVATNNFHLTNKIGKGGFGTVYKVVVGIALSMIRIQHLFSLLSPYCDVGSNEAFKQQKALTEIENSSVIRDREFLTEIETISNVKHPNLVELLGCCVHGPKQILVYEYLENNSIDRALLAGPRRSIKLDWERRSAICMGTAKGLAFLHEELVPHIVHRDIKASNILLDKDFIPKIGDFGLAKLFPDDITHISTKIAGTTYVVFYHLAWELHEEGKLLDLVDPELEEFPKDEVLRYMKVALFCTQANASRRPVMSQVIQMLSKNVRLNEKELTPPGFFEDSGRLSGKTSKNKSSDASTSYQTTSFPITITQVFARSWGYLVELKISDRA
ncbi:hypothetical protein DH2020_032851 [Rehmannia glutinosa]|uniref:Protein kinase domain-containing protein n=1 Tax=Rehmannia glutinosa TaxID=99300 RepID=A0ABR0VEQ5_REHGL